MKVENYLIEQYYDRYGYRRSKSEDDVWLITQNNGLIRDAKVRGIFHGIKCGSKRVVRFKLNDERFYLTKVEKSSDLYLRFKLNGWDEFSEQELKIRVPNAIRMDEA